MRGLPFAAVLARAVCAGIIASSNGSAMDVPRPRSTVRRERCFLVMNTSCLLSLGMTRGTALRLIPGMTLDLRGGPPFELTSGLAAGLLHAVAGLLRRLGHLERSAVDHRHHDR